MKALRAFEASVIRIEGAVAVALVLLMLVLAGYNVAYRNLLVPLQKKLAHSGPPVVVQMPAAGEGEPVERTPLPAKSPAAAPSVGAAEGFGGDWGEDAEVQPAEVQPAEGRQAEVQQGGATGSGAAPSPGGTDGAGVAEGFAGDWGEGDGAAAPPPAPVPQTAKSGGADGFGGDWGEDDGASPQFEDKAAPATARPVAEPVDTLDDEEDPFANLPMIDAAPAKPAQAADEPLGGPPPKGSFADQMIEFIDAIKLSWIDVVLRQLVILVAFLGGMLATQRGKHINVDALSKLISAKAGRIAAIAANLLALGVCIVLARAGVRLVEIGREHPKLLVPWADEWHFQLMYPLGFALLAFHFAVRVAESASGAPPATALHPLERPPSPPVASEAGGEGVAR